MFKQLLQRRRRSQPCNCASALPCPPPLTREGSWRYPLKPLPPRPRTASLILSSSDPELDPFSLVDEVDHAALKGDVERLRQLLARYGALAECRDFFYGRTPLMSACYEGQMEVAKFLAIECQVHLDTQDNGGWTAAYWSAIRGQAPLLDLLLSLGANHTVPDVRGHIPLMVAAEVGEEEAVLRLLRHDPRRKHVNWRDGYGNTALVLAAQGGHVGCVRLLLEYGAKDESGVAVCVSREKGYRDCEVMLQSFQLYPLWLARQTHNDVLLAPLLPPTSTTTMAPRGPILDRYQQGQPLPSLPLLEGPTATATATRGGCLPFLWRSRRNGRRGRRQREEEQLVGVARYVVSEMKEDLFVELLAMMAPSSSGPQRRRVRRAHSVAPPAREAVEEEQEEEEEGVPPPMPPRMWGRSGGDIVEALTMAMALMEEEDETWTPPSMAWPKLGE